MINPIFMTSLVGPLTPELRDCPYRSQQPRNAMTETRTVKGYKIELEHSPTSVTVIAFDPLHHISISIEGAWNAAIEQLATTAVGHLDFMRAQIAAAEA
jgi:hypothetical protein